MSINICHWKIPAQLPTLKEHEIHVWCVVLTCTEAQEKSCYALLSEDERMRVERLHFARDRRRFTIARAALRNILAHYLQQTPQSLQFTYSAHGKPALINNPSLQFNLSHSKDLALYALTYHHAIGVDIEYQKADVDVEGIAQRFFSNQENQELQMLVTAKRLSAFYRGWTCKEAFLKAHGKGLSYPLAEVIVTLDPQQTAKLHALGKQENLAEWQLYELNPADHYSAALVIQAQQFFSLYTGRWLLA